MVIETAAATVPSILLKSIFAISNATDKIENL